MSGVKLTKAEYATLSTIVNREDKAVDTRSDAFAALQHYGLAYAREDQWGELYVYATPAGRAALSPNPTGGDDR